MKEETVKIGKNTLRVLLSSSSNCFRKSESLLSDHYQGGFELSPTSMTSIMEIRIASSILNDYLQSLVNEADEHKVDDLHLTPSEIELIATLAKSLDIVSRASFQNTNLLDH